MVFTDERRGLLDNLSEAQREMEYFILRAKDIPEADMVPRMCVVLVEVQAVKAKLIQLWMTERLDGGE